MKARLFTLLGLTIVSVFASTFLTSTPVYAEGEKYRWIDENTIEATVGRFDDPQVSGEYPAIFKRNGSVFQAVMKSPATGEYVVPEGGFGACQITFNLSVAALDNSGGRIAPTNQSGNSGCTDAMNRFDKTFAITDPQKGPPSDAVDYENINCNDEYGLDNGLLRCRAIKACIKDHGKTRNECLWAWNNCLVSLAADGSSTDDYSACEKIIGSGDTSGGADGDDSAPPPDPCNSLGDFDLRWIGCPLLLAGTQFASFADSFIEGQLHTGTEIFDTSTTAGKNFRAVWSSFRTVGLALLLIIGLVMVISQAAGLQIFDAYAFRKTLPRLLIAVIGVALSWELMKFAVIFFNDIGHWAQSIVLAPFQAASGSTQSDSSTLTAVLGGTFLGVGSLATASVFAVTLGPLGLLSLLGTVVIALLIGLGVVLAREAIIFIAVPLACLAIPSWVLPGTKKLWDFWQNSFITALLVFPIIMLFLATGKALSFVTDNGIMKVLWFIFPYIALPMAFKLAGGLMTTIFSIANDKSRGVFDRLGNFRSEQRKSRKQDALEGTGNTWLSKNKGLAKFVGQPVGSAYRRGQMASKYGIKGLGGATYSEGLKKLREARAQEALKDDMGRAAGDDDSNAIALQGNMNEKEFVRQYQARVRGSTAAQALTALRGLETGYNAKIGSEAMRVAAFKAKAASSTAYDSSGNYQAPTEDAASMIADGLISTQDAAAAFKSNQKRAELNAVGFGSWMKHLDQATDRYKQGRRGAGLVTDAEATALRKEALDGVEPGRLVAGRHETVTALSGQMETDLNETLGHVDAATGNVVGTDEVALGRELAKLAGRYDAMGQANPKNAQILADNVLSHTLVRAATPANARFRNRDGTVMTVQEMIDSYRGNQEFLNMRREYATREGYQGGGQIQAPPGS